ncbi:unnamed protein product [Heligmosomoides polygyrus]|uniref:MARVEL domain-containing protein n=1 Tax=Heligmosomoides polygyrus TaxID=6339 RepID=A0A3P8CFN0_HELPZ|nr:unnamed protein product [Heligmosomoides polygyrus]
MIGAVTALILIGSVGSHFSPTYAALATATMATVTGPALVLAFAFNLPVATSSIDWIFWETLYTGSFAFLFLVNSITMVYSSIRWQYTAWWLGSVICALVGAAFLVDLIILVRLQLTSPKCRHIRKSDLIRGLAVRRRRMTFPLTERVSSPSIKSTVR